MSLKDICVGIKKVKSLLVADMEKQLKLLGITYEKIYTSQEISSAFDVNRKYRRKQILDVLMNESEDSEVGLLISDKKVREKNIKKFVNECAFDFTNKLCAIRLLEERNLIAATIKKFKEYGDKSEVQKNLGQVSYSLLDRDPYDGLKYAIDSTLRELSTQIKVLFEVNDEHSLLFPETKTIKEIVKIILEDIPIEDWQKDDFIGWTYQYFVEDEKEEIEQADTLEQIAAKTQVYTYDWIVRYIVDNTLGVYWKEIKSGERPVQDVETIKLMDASCGSGSFLTYAFDKFYEIYKEEGKISEENIPNYIVSRNLFGMDIDERAVQLAALNIYIKAKQRNANVQIDKFNIICTGNRIKEDVNINKYLQTIAIDTKLRDVINNIVQEAFNYIKENNILGSLMKIEDIINPLIDDYIGGRRRLSVKEVEAKKEKILEKSDQITLFKPELEQLTLDSIEDIRYFDTREEFVDYLRQKILDCVDYVVTNLNKSNDINSKMFAKDLSRGSNFISAMMQKYEIIVGNPPYLGNLKMGISLRVILKKFYDISKSDLYSTFIHKSIDLCHNNGFIGLLTPDTYLFISTFKNFRRFILKNIFIKKAVELGKKTFKGVNVSVAILISRKVKSLGKQSIFIDLMESDNQQLDLQNHNYKEYLVDNDVISNLETCSFMYWSPKNILEILTNCPKLSPNYAVAKSGINTGDNNKFVFFKWEVKNFYKNKKWVQFAKGGGYNKYLGRNECILLADFDEMRKYSGSAIRNSDAFFKEGITFSDITSNNMFSARFLPKGFITAMSGSGIYSKNINVKYLLGMINSKLINYILNLLNPTVHFQVGDINKIPIKQANEKNESIIAEFINFILLLKTENYNLDILSDLYNTDGISLNNGDTSENISIREIYIKFYNQYNERIFKIEELQYFVDELILHIYGIDHVDRLEILKKFGDSIIGHPIINNYFQSPTLDKIEINCDLSNIMSEEDTIEKLKSGCNKALNCIKNYYECNEGFFISKEVKPQYISISRKQYVEVLDRIKELCLIKDMDIIKISQDLKINPRSVLKIMNEEKLVIEESIRVSVCRYLQTIARKVFNDDSDGIILLQEIVNKVHDELAVIYGDRATSIETEINNIIGKDIQKWLRDEFAQDYINNIGYDKKEDKYAEIKNPWEPLIWKGQSPKKNFTVFVWRYKITPDTELKIGSQYLENEIDSYKKKIKDIDSQFVTMDGREKNNLERERDQMLNILDDLNEYHKWIKENGVKLRGMWLN